MRKLLTELRNRKIEYKKLQSFGFCLDQNCLVYKKLICNDKFEAVIVINNDEVQSLVIELEFNEEYVLVDVLSSQGDFVGNIRKEYEAVISEFINKCTKMNIFKSNQSNVVINYIKEKYGDELEFLWKKFPNNAIWRNKFNEKWYGALLTIPSNKLGLQSIEEIEIIDLRYQSELINNIIDNKKIFPAYHMNKKNWITIVLDERVNNNDLIHLIDNSYSLSLNK